MDVDAQKKKEEEKAREKELNDLFKVAVSQPKVPVGMASSPPCHHPAFMCVCLPRFRVEQIDLGALSCICYAHVLNVNQ